jgi:DNA (cytosine-5)-methyltransferase 1
LNELALFAGAGGGLLGSILSGWRTKCAVEISPFCRKLLLQRQKDQTLPKFPIWDDIKTFDGMPWRGTIDIVTGGFPCQDISSAGNKKGLFGERSSLWFEMLRVVSELQPRFVFVENSAYLRVRGLPTVLKGFASLGYHARWCVLGAGDIGAPHRRKRLWILAYTNNERKRAIPVNAKTSWTQETKSFSTTLETMAQNSSEGWWAFPRVSRMVDGVANRMDRVTSVGNGQVPGVVKCAWEILSQGLI